MFAACDAWLFGGKRFLRHEHFEKLWSPVATISCRGYIGTRNFQQLERRFIRLRILQAQLEIRSPVKLAAHGAEYALPLKRETLQVTAPAHTSCDDLEYLGGFFDGDGSVSTSGRCFALTVSQSAHKGEVLLRFVSRFGGAIYTHSKARGICRPTAQWVVTGGNGRRAADTLASVCPLKRQQLQLVASDLPTCNLLRTQRREQLRLLNGAVHPDLTLPGWAYFAGLFDAEGHIKLSARYAVVGLEVQQKHKQVLDAIQFFVEKELGIASQVYTNSRCYSWVVSRTSSSKLVLKRLLSSGLTLKKALAERAVTVDVGNFLQVRDAMCALVGNQSRYSRLDADGCSRSVAIAAAAARLARSKMRGDLSDAQLRCMQDGLDQLRRDHRLYKLVSRVALLRADIRGLLMQGAQRIGFRSPSANART